MPSPRTPIRKATDALLAKEAALLPVKTAWMFIPAKPLGLRDKAFQGESFFTAPNPPFGAVIIYYLKDELKTKKKARLAAEKKVASKGGDVFYPSWDLRYPASNPPAPTRASSDEDEDQFRPGPHGPLAMPGTYNVTLAKKMDGTVTPLGEPVELSAAILGTASL